LIDDFTYNDSKQREMFKALLSSEPTTIREAYTNKKFKHGIPTIICTNNKKFFELLITNQYFQNDGIFVVVDENLGPPETRPRDRDFVEANDLAMRLFLSNTKKTNMPSSLKLKESSFSKAQPQQQKQHRTLLLTHLIENRRPVFEIIRTNTSKQISRDRGGGDRNNYKESYSTIK
jgi:hypothetical protein